MIIFIFSGEFGHIGERIEDFTSWAWDNIFQIILSKVSVQLYCVEFAFSDVIKEFRKIFNAL